MISRGYTWINDDERTDADEERAATLARRWSALKTEIENESFDRQARIEDGCDYEPPECKTCGGRTVVGVENPTSWRADCVAMACCWTNCRYCNGTAHNASLLIGIVCPDCDGAGYDRSGERHRAQRDADRNLEIELIEDKLAAIGARMMRPYEHWNEDERLMEYLERDRY